MTVQNEVMIASVRKEKDTIDDLVKQLEARATGLRNEDMQYIDVVLKSVEDNLKRIRKNLK
jgi:hypothetical protein